MCGLVGFLLPEGAPHPDLGAWSELIRHRGPDQGGTATERGFGIGTRRLSILDLSPAGSQPMQTAHYIVGFNGEIYNHLELRAELQASGVKGFTSHSDTETVLKAIEYWGIEEALNRLNGMFALAVWDRGRGALTLARDSLGIKPLYYLSTEQGVYFGSELKTLRSFAAGKIARDGLALYLYFGFVPAPYSLLERVWKVQPGEAVVFKGTGRECRRIAPRAWAHPAQLARGTAERVQQVRAAVEAAVRRQLQSDVPVGLFLSGGVDSSIIARVAAAHGSGLVSFSLRPDHILADPGAERDAEIAACSARELGLSHHEVRFRPEDLTGELDVFLRLIDEPVAEPYAIAEVLLSRRAREVGVPVVLTGHGGDEVFLGYPTYVAALKGDRYNRIPHFAPLLTALAAVPGISGERRRNLLGTASVWRKRALERYAIVSSVYFSLEEVAALTGLAPDHVGGLVQSIVSGALEAISSLPNGRGLNTAALFGRLDLLLKVPGHYNLRLDRATMSASVEARVPLQDLELIGLALQLPSAELMRGGAKGFLKQAFADVLPAEVARRPKQTFQAPVLSWLRGPLAPWVAAQLARLPAPLRGDPPIAGLALDSSKHAYRAWTLALLEAWRQASGLEY